MSSKGESYTLLDQENVSIELPSGTIDPAWMIAARSYFADRFAADVERILLPGRTVGGGKLILTRVSESKPPPSAFGRLSPIALQKISVESPFVDIRRNAPGNWAHFLTHHLPIIFKIARVTGTPLEDITLVLPRRAPTHILETAALLGLKAACTDGTVTGAGFNYEPRPLVAMRQDWVEGTHSDFVQRKLAAARRGRAAAHPLPLKAFISRRKSRRLLNEPEIEAALAERGVKKLYAEDLSPIDQFRLFEETELVVAIHGAAVAPLLYRSAFAHPLSLIEIFPCGHVTNAWRTVAHQLGVRWIGVRGRMRPEHLVEAYRFDRPFLRYSTQDFEADPDSLILALEWASEAGAEAPGMGVN